MSTKHPIYSDLAKTVHLLPTPTYWLDINGELIGANRHFYTMLGITPPEVGDDNADIQPFKVAYNTEHDKQVLQSGVASQQIEQIIDNTGKTRFSQVYRQPLLDDNHQIIGLIATVVDITVDKEAEQLRLKNHLQKHKLDQQKKFKSRVEQVAHDIRSPLASLEMLAKHSIFIPELERISFQEIAENINDIINAFQNNYAAVNSRSAGNGFSDEPQPTLVYKVLLQELSTKKAQYKQKGLKFDVKINPDSYFSFINIHSVNLKRVLACLMNEVLEALDSNQKISLALSSDAQQVKIVITSANNIHHRFDMTRIEEMVAANNGRLVIELLENNGSGITISFARIAAPQWIVSELIFTAQDIIVILDDDDSIHHAWDIRLNKLIKSYPDIQVEHFKVGQELLDFVNSLPAAARENVFLLTDYELLQQNSNGVEIIKKSQVKRTVLVTNHYSNYGIRKEAALISTKLLPKQLATEVIIKVGHTLAGAEATSF